MQRQARDEVGDERLRVAKTAFEDHAMLSRGLADDDGDSKHMVIGQAHLVLNGMAFLFESIMDVVGHVADAIPVSTRDDSVLMQLLQAKGEAA